MQLVTQQAGSRGRVSDLYFGEGVYIRIWQGRRPFLHLPGKHQYTNLQQATIAFFHIRGTSKLIINEPTIRQGP